MAFYGGLRQTEIFDLQLEKFSSSKEGVFVVHSRAKQRSDKRETRFLVPRFESGTNYAKIIESYLAQVKSDIGKYTGRVFWTGRGHVFVNQPMGRNCFFAVPHEIAKILKKENPTSAYSFHSFRIEHR